jgi:YesN/AraC family two-component response regulator
LGDIVLKKELKLFGKGKKILFVDDDHLIRTIFSKSCDEYFDTICLASNGQEALELFKKHSFDFDIIITDINMPSMTGVQLIEKIKDISPEQIVIVLSGTNDTEHFVNLLNLGVDGFILKPFGFRKIAKKIIQVLESIYYKKLLFDMKKEKIILEYEHKMRLQKLKDKQIEKDKRREEIVKHATEVLEKFGTMVPGKLTCKDFFDLVQKDAFGQEKIDMIISSLKKVLLSIQSLLTIADNMYYNLNSEVAEASIRTLCEDLLCVFNSLNQFEILSTVAEPFYLMFDFFDDYHYIDTLDHEEVKELISIEFIADDIKKFLENVFISKTCENILLFSDLFTQNFTQLESNIQNINRDSEDGDLDFF